MFVFKSEKEAREELANYCRGHVDRLTSQLDKANAGPRIRAGLLAERAVYNDILFFLTNLEIKHK